MKNIRKITGTVMILIAALISLGVLCEIFFWKNDRDVSGSIALALLLLAINIDFKDIFRRNIKTKNENKSDN